MLCARALSASPQARCSPPDPETPDRTESRIFDNSGADL